MVSTLISSLSILCVWTVGEDWKSGKGSMGRGGVLNEDKAKRKSKGTLSRPTWFLILDFEVGGRFVWLASAVALTPTSLPLSHGPQLSSLFNETSFFAFHFKSLKFRYNIRTEQEYSCASVRLDLIGFNLINLNCLDEMGDIKMLLILDV